MPLNLDRLPAETAADLAEVLDRLAGLGIDLAARIARHGLSGNGRAPDADGLARATLAESAMRFLALETREEVDEINPAGGLTVALSPLNGASALASNVAPATVFGIFPAGAAGRESLLRPCRRLLASGYVIHGPQCCLMLRVGTGATRRYLLDPDARIFRDLGALPEIPPDCGEYAINAADYRHWPAPIRAYIDDRLAGAEGPIGRDFNMCWTGSLVAEAHRILIRGGIFLSPGDDRKGHEMGRLRLIHECGPIAHLVEGAGGRASDGVMPILDLVPLAPGQRTPFIFGGANNVARVTTYFDLPEDESALFSKRGLFR